MARPGGVLTRAGHTEAGCDLARLAGFEPAAVIVEILNDDGTMARRPELERFAREHGLAIGTIADLIRYRLSKESSIECVADRQVETESGDVPHALVRGPRARPPAPRAGARRAGRRRRRWCACTSRDTPRDLIGIRGEHAGWTLRAALERIAREPHGIVDPAAARGVARRDIDRRRRARARRGRGRRRRRCCAPTASARRSCATSASRRMRVLSAPRQLLGISAFGLEVTGYEE